MKAIMNKYQLLFNSLLRMAGLMLRALMLSFIILKKIASYRTIQVFELSAVIRLYLFQELYDPNYPNSNLP